MRRRVIVIHGTLALVFHELFVIMDTHVHAHARAREWLRVRIGIRIGGVEPGGPGDPYGPGGPEIGGGGPRRPAFEEGGPAATASGLGGSRLLGTLQAVPEVASEAMRKAEMGGLRGETWEERLRESPSAGTSLVPAKWC